MCRSTGCAGKKRQIRTATVNGVQWSFAVEHGGAIITSGQKEKPAIDAWTEGEVVIPTMLNGFSVREIGDYAFYGCGAMSSITIPNGVVRVGAFAFFDCLAIRVLDFPTSVLSIGKRACCGMKALESVKISGNVGTIEDKLFEQCVNLREIDLGNGLRTVSGKSFESCRSLRKLVFPETLESIDNRGYTYGVCSGCSSLKEVVFLGPPPTIKNFGVDLNGKVRYTTKYRLEWERWQKAKAIEGMEMADSVMPKENRPTDSEDVTNPFSEPVSQEAADENLPRGGPPDGDGKLPADIDTASNHKKAVASEAPASEKTDSATPPSKSAPLILDASLLRVTFDVVGISHYRCRSALKDFEKAIADANAAAAERRTKLDTTARVYLKQQMEKAQAEGDLDKVLIFKTALESARDGKIVGDNEAIVKLRESYAKQLLLSDNALRNAGLSAARTLIGTLDWQKKEATKKGDIDDAQKIAAFQKKVEEWTKTIP